MGPVYCRFRNFVFTLGTILCCLGVAIILGVILLNAACNVINYYAKEATTLSQPGDDCPKCDGLRRSRD